MSEQESTGGPPDDPFQRALFDDEFVMSAPVTEPSATERLARVHRIEEERRRLTRIREEESWANSEFSPRSTASRVLRSMVAVVALVGLVAVAARTNLSLDRRAGPVPDTGPHADMSSTRVELAGGMPPPGFEAQPAPLGTPSAAISGSGGFAFMQVQPGTAEPVAYDPCRPVHVVVNDRTAPKSGDRLIREALADLTSATGLVFVIDGATDETPLEGRAPYQPERYPGRWAPVLVAWSDPAEAPDLAGDAAGSGGSLALSLPGRGALYVTGQVVLDGPQLVEALDRPRGTSAAKAVVHHEFGHLVGLNHVDDKSQIMYPSTQATFSDFAAGDLLGLARLGRGACFPDL